jgi:hypothetical protein
MHTAWVTEGISVNATLRTTDFAAGGPNCVKRRGSWNFRTLRCIEGDKVMEQQR